MLNHVMALLVNRTGWGPSSPDFKALDEPAAFAEFARAALPASREDAVALWPVVYRADMAPWTLLRDSRILKPAASALKAMPFVAGALTADVSLFMRADYGRYAPDVAALFRMYSSASDAFLKASAAYVAATLWLELKNGRL